MDSPKLERLLCLMMLLTTHIRYSVEELVVRMQISSCSIYSLAEYLCNIKLKNR